MFDLRGQHRFFGFTQDIAIYGPYYAVLTTADKTIKKNGLMSLKYC